MRCPGQDTRFWKPEDIFEMKCPGDTFRRQPALNVAVAGDIQAVIEANKLMVARLPINGKCHAKKTYIDQKLGPDVNA